MSRSRLNHALDTGALALPTEGRIVVFGLPGDAELPDIAPERIEVVQPFFPDRATLTARGVRCVAAPEGRYAAAVVTLPRARERAMTWIAEAAAATDGPVVVDGARTDGADAMLKACRARAPVAPPVAKAHGKVFLFDADATAFADWHRGPAALPSGWITAPGVFSADGPDPASEALAAALPAIPGQTVADLGGGWGYLARRMLERSPDIAALHVVEADAVALDCARRNVTDPRAAFHWADATTWRPPAGLDAVVTNPPFHAGRQPDPALGRAFIAAAAGMLAPTGALWLVANRHLPYETTLAERFRDVSEAGGDTRFKILHAARPRRAAA